MNKDFGTLVTKYLSEYLPIQKNASANTISSYCYTFKLLLSYCRDVEKISIRKINIENIDSVLLQRFLYWLENERGCSSSTLNQRLFALRSFFRYVQVEEPQLYMQCAKVLDMPQKKKVDHGINYLSVETTKVILSKPNIFTVNGRRDLVLLCLLYDTGARVSEIINLKVRDIRFDNPAKVRLLGKGNKVRDVPILEKTQKMLREYLLEQRMLEPHKIDYPIFFNHMGQKLTRSGVSYILKKYADGCVSEGEFNISPHLLRHTKAMHLLQAGVNIIYIKNLLGHVDIKTTELYARANLDMKKKALEAVDDISPDIVPIWQQDADLLNWLDTLSKVK